MICIDASVAAKWLLNEDYSDRAEALLNRALATPEPLVAPPLLPSEVANILRQRMQRGTLTLIEARALLAQFRAVPISLQAPETIYEQALVLADRYNLPAVYDSHYVVLAQLLGATLWTADEWLLNTLAGRLPFVQAIATYPLPPTPETLP